MTLTVPALPDADTLTAALAYAEAGWYLIPVHKGTKNPGSVVGNDWQHRSSRDPKQITAWYAGTDHGIALHVGRSGAVVFDLDHPEKVPAALASAMASAPFQATRDGGRGHLVYLAPPGRRLGNSTGRLGHGWGEVRGTNGVIMVAPSEHPDGGEYRWLRTGPIPVLPDALAELLPDATEAADAVTDAEIHRFCGEHSSGDRPELLAGMLHEYDRKIADGASRHDTTVTAACWAMREARAGLYPAVDAAMALRERFRAALAGEPNRRPVAEFAGILAWAIGQAEADDPEARRRSVNDRMPDVGVTDLIGQLRRWQHLPDPTHILAELAVAATAEDTDGEPAWLLLVQAPSAGKTEAVDLLHTVAAGHLDEVSVAGLLSWTKGKNPRPTGVLTRVTTGLVTFGDLSTLIASSEKGMRDVVFALLRRVYDGRLHRDIGAPSGAGSDRPLSWEGRLSVVGAVTGVIDRYSNHADALGSRWLYCRLPVRDTEAKRAAAALARRGGLGEHRKEARRLASRVVHAARPRLGTVEIRETVADAIEDAALVCCWGRATVPRNGYGAREIDGEATVEEPPRLVRQLTTVARGLLALGCDDVATADICRRLALDSMPVPRRSVLAVLTDAALPDSVQPLTTSTVARRGGLDRGVARRSLEDLELVGVVVADRTGADPDDYIPDRRPCSWALAEGDGKTIADVIGLAGGVPKM